MNVTLQARSAYATNQTAIRTPRSIEAQLLSQVTSDLRKAATRADDFGKVVDAIHRNRQMWTTFATGVADKDNDLPNQLRAQIFYLAEFTEAHSRKVLRKEENVNPLIEINMSILRGLSSTGQNP